MKVINFINELDKIGYNDETELTFGCINGCNWYPLFPHPNFDDEHKQNISFSREEGNTIDFCLNVDENVKVI